MKYYPIEVKCDCGDKLKMVVYQYGELVYECDCGNTSKVPVEKEP